MPNSLSATGITVATTDEIATDLRQGLQAAYGTDINTDPSSPDGQMVGIFSQAETDVLDLVVDVYNSFSVSSAYGVSLQVLVEINGMTVKGGSYTTTPVNATFSGAGNLPGLDQTAVPPYQLQDTAGNLWTLALSYSAAGAGTQALLFRAATLGPISPIPNTITVQATPLGFVASVNNPAFTVTTPGAVTSGSPVITGISSTAGMAPGMVLSDADGFFPAGTTVKSVDSATQIHASANATGGAPTTENITVASPGTVLGTVAETDAQLRVRQAQSFALAATGPDDAVEGQLLNLPNVTSAIVVENRTGSTVGTIPAHSIWCVVVGGTPAQIAQVIYSKSSCCGLVGAQSYTIIRKNGQPATIYWDNGLSQALWVKFSVVPAVSGITLDKALLAQELAAALASPYWALNQQASIGDVVRSMFEIDPQAVVINPAVSVDGATWAQSVSPQTAQYFFNLPVGNITIQ